MMRLTNILFAVFAVASINSSGQVNPEELSTLSPKSFITKIEVIIGPGFSNLGKGKKAPSDQVFNAVYSGGVGLSHSINKSLEINSKILFERKGNKMEYTSTFYDTNGPTTSRFEQGNKLGYVTGTLLTRYFFSQKKKFYLGFGGYLSYLLKSTTYTKEYSLQGELVSYYQADILGLDNYDIGISLNLGYIVPITKKIDVNIQFLHNIGLLNIADKNYQGNSEVYLNNSITSLLIGITTKYNRYE